MSIDIPRDFGAAYDKIVADLNPVVGQALSFIYQDVAKPAFEFALETDERRPLVVLGALLSGVPRIARDATVRLRLKQAFQKDYNAALGVINSSVIDASHEMLGDKLNNDVELELPQGKAKETVRELSSELRYRVAKKLAVYDLLKKGLG